jgi:hypothetical protein
MSQSPAPEFYIRTLFSPIVVRNVIESAQELIRENNPFRHRTGYAAAHGEEVTPETIETTLKTIQPIPFPRYE